MDGGGGVKVADQKRSSRMVLGPAQTVPVGLKELASLEELALNEGKAVYLKASGDQETRFRIKERFVSVDLNPRKGILLTHHQIAEGGGMLQYLVQEDNLVIAQLRNNETLNTYLSTCAAVVVKGSVDGKPVVALTHFDACDSEAKVREKANRAIGALKQNKVRVQEAYLDFDESAEDARVNVLREKFLGLKTLERPAGTYERALVVNNAGIGTLSKTQCRAVGQAPGQVFWKS